VVEGEDAVSGDEYTLGQTQYTTQDGIAAQGVVTHIDIESINAAIPWLDGLKQYIQDHLVPDVGKMTITNDDFTILFGQLSSSGDVAGKHSSYVTAAIQTYQAIAQSLDAASRATADIVKNYKDVEHNNTVTAQQIEQAFASEASPGSAPSGTAPTTQTASTTQPTSTNTNAATQGSY
jgi:hypothetical protein